MTTAVKERPILFSDPMVRGLLDGRKTMTRRVLNPQPALEDRGESQVYVWRPKSAKLTGHPAVDETCGPVPCCRWRSDVNVMDSGAAGIVDFCPYGKPGDRLWVREAHGLDLSGQVYYREGFDPACGWQGIWRPSIHMRRRDSRITLEITDVRVERVQQIDELDAAAEGVGRIELSPAPLLSEHGGLKCYGHPLTSTYQHAFRVLWDKLNAERGYGWDVNPFVWAITFRRIIGG